MEFKTEANCLGIFHLICHQCKLVMCGNLVVVLLDSMILFMMEVTIINHTVHHVARIPILLAVQRVHMQ